MTMFEAHNQRPRRILFVAEAVTLAHVVRPIVLARSLDPTQYDITLACDDRYLKLFGELSFPQRALATLPTAQFLDNLAKGRPVYDVETLRSYVREDLALLEEIKPDLVVGDFRLSLSISARVAGIPYTTITNAYWSPYSKLPFPLPEHPMTKVLGVWLAQRLFDLVRPAVFALHARPLNQVRREYGLASLGIDLRCVYTDADQVLYADIPELVPMAPLPANHHWLGPIVWSPNVPKPDWWDDLPTDRPIVYVALGSSGQNERILPIILQGLADLPVTVMAATFGRGLPIAPPGNAYLADFLPGTEAAARSELVICNGGSLATHQALVAGVPVIGVVSNMDQHLNMLGLEGKGVGMRLRAGQLTRRQLLPMVKCFVGDGTRRNLGPLFSLTVSTHEISDFFAQALNKV